MKYLYLNPPKVEDKILIPIDKPLSIEIHDHVPYLCLGGARLFNIDPPNVGTLLPFIAESFAKTDVVNVNLACPPEKELIKCLF